MSQAPELQRDSLEKQGRRVSKEHAGLLQRQPTILRIPEQKKADIFDAEDFNATNLINQLYPDESSLTDLDRFMVALKRQINAVDQEIFDAVRSQGGAHTRARNDLTVAQGQIEELFTRIRDIQQKAEASEQLVQEICRDIKKLDYAKRHLTNAITALRRLAMLTAAVSELEVVAGRRDQYRKAANLVEAVHQLMEYFQQYEAIPKIKSLSKRLATLEQTLRASVLDDFKLLLGQGSGEGRDAKLSPESLDRLSNGCLVVDALGPQVRDQLMDWMCEREMGLYNTMFGGTADTTSGGLGSSAGASRLERFEQRFGWFRRRLEDKKELWGIFPEAWRVPQVLCLTFCKITKASLKRALSDDEGQGGLSTDIAPLIKAVVATNKFEREMAAMFGGGTVEEDDEDAESSDHMSATEARRRLEKFRHKAKQEAAAAEAAKLQAGGGVREAQEAIKVQFEGAISEAFEDALRRYYVAEEEKELVAHLDTVIKEEQERKWLPAEEENTRILGSANKLFLKIRMSLTRCSKNVSKGATLVALAGSFKRVLAAYAQELYKRIPKTAAGTTTATPGLVGGSTDWYVRVSDEDERVLCCLLATAEFCRETIDALVGALRKDVKPALADQLDMSDEESAFMGVASATMNVLVLGINTRLDAALLEMARARWDSVEQPGDDSTFVNTVRKVLLDCAPRLGAELDTVNFAFFCDKAARMFVPRLNEGLLRLRRISDKGTLQLAIDVDSIRRILLDFPKVARGEAYSDDDPELGPNSSYAHYVEREMGAAINLVKVLQSKAENLVDTYLLLMPANAQSMMEFQRLCEMKALTRKQQQDLMAAYQARVGGDDGISPSAPSAASLANFKAGVNNLTRELASTLAIGSARGGRGPDSPSKAGTFLRGGGPAHMRNGSADERGGFAAGVKEIGGKTKETFAKMATFITAVNKLGSTSDPNMAGAAQEGSSSQHY